jgi:ribosomal protein L40E
MSDTRRRTTCRVCGTATLDQMLSLGSTPLANAFLRSPAEFATARRYPLDLYVCRRCALPQLADVVDPEVLFRHYLYVSGTIEWSRARLSPRGQTV